MILRFFKPTTFFLALIACLLTVAVRAQDLGTLRKQRPFRLSSGLSLNMGGYAVSGIENRRMPFTWSLSGTPAVEVYGIKFPFLLSFSNQQRSFQQPFNQFGVAPTYRWAKLHLGYSNVRFSNYTLAGRRFLGAGIELNPGKWRFGFVQGRFQKAIEYDSTAVKQTGILPYNVPVPAFSRVGYATKFGFGGKKTFVELTYLRAHDRENSISANFRAMPNLRPEENAVVGLHTQLTLFKKLVWQTEVAASAYTRDLRSDSIDLGKYPKIERFSKIILPRESTQLFTAGETSLGYSHKYFGLQLRYRRIDPDFKSMGAYFFQTDIEQYTVAPSMRLWKGKINLGGSVGLQRNNLTNARLHTTERLIRSFSASINPRPSVGVSISMSNFGVTQAPNPTLSAVPTYDTLRLAQVSRSMTITPHFRFGRRGLRQTITMSANVNSLDGQNNSDASAKAAMQTFGGNCQYQIANTRTKLNAQAGLNFQKVENTYFRSSTMGLNLGAGKGWRKTSINLNAGFFQNSIIGQGKGNTLQGGLGFQYKIRKGASLNARLGTMRVHRPTQADFTEWFGNTGLSWQF